MEFPQSVSAEGEELRSNLLRVVQSRLEDATGHGGSLLKMGHRAGQLEAATRGTQCPRSDPRMVVTGPKACRACDPLDRSLTTTGTIQRAPQRRTEPPD